LEATGLILQPKENVMTLEEQITKMTLAIKQAVKVMGDRFGSTETDVARTIEDLKASLISDSPKTSPVSK